MFLDLCAGGKQTLTPKFWNTPALPAALASNGRQQNGLVAQCYLNSPLVEHQNQAMGLGCLGWMGLFMCPSLFCPSETSATPQKFREGELRKCVGFCRKKYADEKTLICNAISTVHANAPGELHSTEHVRNNFQDEKTMSKTLGHGLDVCFWFINAVKSTHVLFLKISYLGTRFFFNKHIYLFKKELWMPLSGSCFPSLVFWVFSGNWFCCNAGEKNNISAICLCQIFKLCPTAELTLLHQDHKGCTYNDLYTHLWVYSVIPMDSCKWALFIFEDLYPAFWLNCPQGELQQIATT